MGSRTLFILVAALVLCCLIFGVVKCSSSNQGISEVKATNEKTKLFKDFKLNEVSEIKIVEKDQTLTLKRGENNWQVAERDNYTANTKKIYDLIRAVWDTNISDPIPLQENQYTIVKLGDPSKAEVSEAEAATVVSFSNGKDDLGTMWLGKPSTAASGGPPNPMTGGASTSDVGRYIKRGNNQLVFITIGETFRGIDTKVSAWLDDNFFEVSKIKTIARKTTKPEEGWKLVREKLADEFTLENAQQGEELDTAKMGAMKTAFSNAQFSDILVGEAAKIPTGNQFTITTFDGLTYIFELGAKDENTSELPMAFTVTGAFTETRTAVEGESEEDKKKADEAFQKALATKKEKLAKDKAFEGRVYQIKSFVVDQLNKSRSELFKEDESKPEPSVGGGGGLVPGISR